LFGKGGLQADARKVEPLVMASFVVAADHFSVRELPAKAIELLVLLRGVLSFVMLFAGAIIIRRRARRSASA